MKHFITFKNYLSVALLSTAFIGCASSKSSTSSQNFSVRYNFLFNANELLDEYERDIVADPEEDFNNILPVFISHPLKPAIMEKVIKKASTIITEKGNSSYIALAHLLMAKAYFNNQEYFTAIGYANDIINDYSSESEINDEARLIKTRALFAIEDYDAASPLSIDLGRKAPEMNRHKSHAHAAAAQGYIFNGHWEQALNHLQLALQAPCRSEEKIRLRYVIAQLLEKAGQSAKALTMYKTVKKSYASYELKLNAALKVIELDPSSYTGDAIVPAPLKKMLKNDIFQDYKDETLYALAGYEYKAKQYQLAITHYLEAAAINGTNKTLTSKAYSNAANLQLKETAAYKESAANYLQAITFLPKSSANYTTVKNKLKYSAEISNLYVGLSKLDSVKNPVENPPYNEKIINGYYEIATLFLQRVQDSVQAEKVYLEINSRFPQNSMHKSVDYALNLLRSRQANNQNNTALASNRFLLKHNQDKFSASMEGVSSINRDRNMKLVKAASMYDEPSFKEEVEPLVPMQTLGTKMAINTIALNTAKTSQSINLQKATLPIGTAPAQPVAPNVSFSTGSESAIYYFIISVEDAALNMSPSRFGIGEFNRSRYAERNLKHRLLEFEQTQVIYVGIFNTVEEARKYAAEITPQLKTIMKTGGKPYSTAIITKENLEKLESDEIYKVYQDFSKS